MEEIRALEKAIGLLGGQSALAAVCGKKQGHVWAWLHRTKRVPAEMVLTIESATGGRVSRHELRPDIFGPAPESIEERAA